MLLFSLSAVIFFVTCSDSGTEPVPEITYDTVTDIDGNVYRVLVIGNQEWLAENLKVTRYRNGDPILNVRDNTDWEQTNEGAYCYYDNEHANYLVYGNLYNWFAVTDPRGLAPEGWHVATDEDWNELEIHLGMNVYEKEKTGYRGESENTGGKLKIKGISLWEAPNTGALNSVYFSALPAGNRLTPGIHFIYLWERTTFWTATEDNTDFAFHRTLFHDNGYIYRWQYAKTGGFAVRCVRNKELTYGNLSGSIYEEGTTIPISGTVLTIGNLKDTTDSAGSYSFDNIESGEQRIIAERDSYFVLCDTIEVQTGTNELDFSLTRQQLGSVTDIDGNVYQTLIIGELEWMIENLKVTRYQNGDLIPEIVNSEEWSNISTGARCSYDNDETIVDEYGYLYNWHSVIDERGLAPEGWRVATDNDFKQLERFTGMTELDINITGERGLYANSGGKLKDSGQDHWIDQGPSATNESGFTAIPGGFRRHQTYDFRDLGYRGFYWTSTEDWNTPEGQETQMICRQLYWDRMSAIRSVFPANYGMSVRCVRIRDN